MEKCFLKTLSIVKLRIKANVPDLLWQCFEYPFEGWDYHSVTTIIKNILLYILGFYYTNGTTPHFEKAVKCITKIYDNSLMSHKTLNHFFYNTFESKLVICNNLTQEVFPPKWNFIRINYYLMVNRWSCSRCRDAWLSPVTGGSYAHCALHMRMQTVITKDNIPHA